MTPRLWTPRLTRRSVIIAAPALILARKSLAWTHGIGIDPWASLDGRLNAPVGATVQFPNLLNPYHYGGLPDGRYRWPTNNRWPSGNLVQPPWMVAGVDYPIGISASAKPLKDVSSNTTLGGSLTTNANTGTSATLSFASVPGWVQGGMFVQDITVLPPSGQLTLPFPPGTTVQMISGGNVTMSQAPTSGVGSGDIISFSHYQGIFPNSAQFIIYITEDNITMDGWDFSAGNGWSFDSELSIGVTLQNFKATFGSNQNIGVGGTLAGNAFVFNSGGTIQYGEFYCNGATVGVQTALGLYGGVGRSVTTTAQYLYIKEASGEAIRGGDSFGESTINIKYSVIQDCGTGQNVFGFHGDSVQFIVSTGITQKSLQKRFTLMYQQQDVNLNGAANQGFTVNGLGNPGLQGVLAQDITANCTQVITGNANMNGFVTVGNPPYTQDNEITDNYAAVNSESLNNAGWQFSNKQAPGTINVEHGNVFMNDGTTLT